MKKTSLPRKVPDCRIIRFVPYYGRYLHCGTRSVTLDPTDPDYGTVRYKGSDRRVMHKQGIEWALMRPIKEQNTKV